MSVIIRLQNLSNAAGSKDIRQFFGSLQIPAGGVHILGGSFGDVFIAFVNETEGRLALKLSGRQICNSSIRLYPSSIQEMNAVLAGENIKPTEAPLVDDSPASPINSPHTEGFPPSKHFVKPFQQKPYNLPGKPSMPIYNPDPSYKESLNYGYSYSTNTPDDIDTLKRNSESAHKVEAQIAADLEDIREDIKQKLIASEPKKPRLDPRIRVKEPPTEYNVSPTRPMIQIQGLNLLNGIINSANKTNNLPVNKSPMNISIPANLRHNMPPPPIVLGPNINQNFKFDSNLRSELNAAKLSMSSPIVDNINQSSYPLNVGQIKPEVNVNKGKVLLGDKPQTPQGPRMEGFNASPFEPRFNVPMRGRFPGPMNRFDSPRGMNGFDGPRGRGMFDGPRGRGMFDGSRGRGMFDGPRGRGGFDGPRGEFEGPMRGDMNGRGRGNFNSARGRGKSDEIGKEGMEGFPGRGGFNGRPPFDGRGRGFRGDYMRGSMGPFPRGPFIRAMSDGPPGKYDSEHFADPREDRSFKPEENFDEGYPPDRCNPEFDYEKENRDRRLDNEMKLAMKECKNEAYNEKNHIITEQSCCIYMYNLPKRVNYHEIRQFLGEDCQIIHDGTIRLKIINDKQGNRIGDAYISFHKPHLAIKALKLNKKMMDENPVYIRICSREEFDSMEDSALTSGKTSQGHKFDRRADAKPFERNPNDKFRLDNDPKVSPREKYNDRNFNNEMKNNNIDRGRENFPIFNTRLGERGDFRGGPPPDRGDFRGGPPPDRGDFRGGPPPDKGDFRGVPPPERGDFRGVPTPDDRKVKMTGQESPDASSVRLLSGNLIYIRGLPMGTTLNSLKSFLGEVRIINRRSFVYSSRDDTISAIVELYSKRDLGDALRLHKTVFKTSECVSVYILTPEEYTKKKDDIRGSQRITRDYIH